MDPVNTAIPKRTSLSSDIPKSIFLRLAVQTSQECVLGVLCRGYTRKEAYRNGVWTPKAENWNGR